MTSIDPIQVAGRLVPDPVAVVFRYCRRHAETLRHYDWLASTSETLTPDLIAATRRPWMNSRISRREEQWLVDRAATAPWEAVPPAARLGDADPEHYGGLYDDAVRLYQHFFEARRPGINRAKISKCLYLMRPGLIPILDRRLVVAYRRQARLAAQHLNVTCPGRTPVRRAYWVAIRRDLLRATNALNLVRDRMRDSGPDSIVTPAADRLSDVRLLDILSWSRAGE